MLRAEDRKAAIRSDGARLAAEHGLRVKDDPALLDEVAGLVEWPVVRLGRIEERFMALPPELLTTSMRTHQKYFACETPEGVLAPFFVVVGNNEPRDGGVQMVLGNERVLRARLSDAQFFWDQDRRKPLADRTGQLGTRVFHAKLGTVAAKVERMAALARSLAHSVDGAGRDDVERAVRLAKADLSSALVGEFPELQGIVGRYLALADGEKPTVAEAIARHYAPAGLADQTPTAPLDVVVALADRLDTLAGFFAIGEIPTGTKDPYALRRAALGVIRIVLENGLRLPLRGPLFIALRLHGLPDCDEGRVIASLLDFIADRLKVVLRERGFRHDLISAVWALGDADDLVRLVARVAALRDFLGTEDGASLLVAYRRAAKIVQIEEKKDGVSYGDLPPDHDAFTLVEEQVLFRQLTVAGELSDVALAEENYGAAMSALASLRWPLDAFFTDVTVNTGEPAVRANRLRLLARIRQAFDRVADFSKIEG
jgi:glycyl-tRNA synthetase beta chain